MSTTPLDTSMRVSGENEYLVLATHSTCNNVVYLRLQTDSISIHTYSVSTLGSLP